MDIFSSLTPYVLLKIVSASAIAVCLYLVGSGNLAGVGAVATLCLIDTIMALYSVHKKGGRITSRKLPDKLVDLAIYIVTIMAMNLLTVVSNRFNALVDLAIGWCAASEALSILEHITELGYKIPIPLLDNLKKTQDGE